MGRYVLPDRRRLCRAFRTLERSSLHDLRLAYLYPPDLRRLLTRAGFRSIQIYGGFDGRPFENDTDELVIEASVE